MIFMFYSCLKWSSSGVVVVRHFSHSFNSSKYTDADNNVHVWTICKLLINISRKFLDDLSYVSKVIESTICLEKNRLLCFATNVVLEVFRWEPMLCLKWIHRFFKILKKFIHKCFIVTLGIKKCATESKIIWKTL